ncbi:MAG: heavy metal translocating P-type ATPase [Fimbriimonadaceae bacterium]|nr:heavy metal translocating P-type ATPase [Fimbriimonadaceae bacterium]QYK58152.1 MAG: heavy metal translocating P-type ATPase [Fimbriimonadaceae bacterium]
MDCPTEEGIIRNRLGKVPEIGNIEFDLMNRILTVNHSFSDEAPIVRALTEVGMKPATNCEVGCNPEPAPSTIKLNILLGIALILALASEFVGWFTGQEKSWPVVGLACMAMILGGKETFTKGIVAVKTFTLNINFLMCLAVIGAIVIGSWPEAAMVTVLFAIAERIESYALDRARNAVRALMELAPEKAWVQDKAGVWIEVPAQSIVLGQRIRVKPGERIPLDGEVALGHSSVNQAPITGESLPVDKGVGDQLFAGTINEQGVLEFIVTGTRGETTLDRIIKTVQEAQGSRAATQRFVDNFAKYYTPSIVIIAVFVATIPLAFGQPFWPWLYKALVMLVIACPCALVISTPVTVVSGLTAAARQGILIKGGVHLESGRNLKVIALDKTGTLTHGKPVVTEIIPMHEYGREKALQIAASLDHLSGHPVAKAIENQWKGELLDVIDFESIAGRGVSGSVVQVPYIIGNHRLIEERGVCCDHVHSELDRLQDQGKTTVLLANHKEVLAIFGVADTLRAESVEAIRDLHKLDVKITMLTGDNASTARAIGSQAGIDDVQAELLPEDKLKVIEALLGTHGSVGMVGDGVNDAPALARATLGFAMGAAGTDTALETADVALMDDDLRKLPAFIQLSKATASILTQNIAIALGIKVIFFALALTGHASLWMAVFADLGGSLLVVGNGLRLLKVLPQAGAH